MAKPTVLLYPGAGSDSDHSSLVAIDGRFGSRGYVERRDFAYRREGRKAPDRATKLMATIREDLGGFSRRRGPVVMGGRSMGGRMTTMVAANVDERGPVDRLAGLVLISYPLHPPGKPENLRVDHLPDVDVPCLFVSGTRDPFFTPDELQTWTAMIGAPVRHVWVDGGRHDLKGADDLIAEHVRRFVADL